MLNISITASMLCDLLNGHMTYTACEALADYLSELQESCHDFVPTIGDIAISFCETSADEVEEGDNVLIELDNGNVIIER